MINRITRLFPIWAIAFSVAAYYNNSFFSKFGFAIIPLLTIVMFGMGMTLTWDNFKAVIKSPLPIILGFSLQYLIMPLAGYIISIILKLSPQLMTGIILVGCSPGGTASNVITYLGNGNVALSITLTLTSTLFAVLLMPALTYLFLNHIIPVPAGNMLLDILQIVVIPVLIGTAINSALKKKIDKARNIFPLISTAAIIIIIAIITALNKPKLAEVNFTVIAAVILHNLTGLTLGYFITKFFKFDKSICRTIGIEVGMQNSGLAVALAVKYFSVVSALPGAIFSIWHNISGSILAGIWRFSDSKDKKNEVNL